MYGPNGRKKVRCACYPCIKAKRGCDLERPCSRCVKKKISEQCLERGDYEIHFNSLAIHNPKRDSIPDDEEEEVQQKQNLAQPSNSDLEEGTDNYDYCSIESLLEVNDVKQLKYPEDIAAEDLHFRNTSLGKNLPITHSSRREQEISTECQ
jgi:hypothetical protein